MAGRKVAYTSARGKSEALQRIVVGIETPDHLTEEEGDLFQMTVASLPMAVWLPDMVQRAAQMARHLAAEKRLMDQVAEKGDVIEREDGRLVVNPAHMALMSHGGAIHRLRSQLGLTTTDRSTSAKVNPATLRQEAISEHGVRERLIEDPIKAGLLARAN